MPEWEPLVCSITQARKCLGGISRSAFYATVLPRLEAIAGGMDTTATVKIAGRRMVRKAVLHVLIEGAEVRQGVAPRPVQDIPGQPRTDDTKPTAINQWPRSLTW